MKPALRKLRPGLLAVAAALTVAPALARDDCDAPVERWQSREAVRQMAAQKGWNVQRLKIDDGCYEIRGTDAQGHGFKARIDPETLQVIKLRQRDKRDRERRREHDPAVHESSTPGNATSSRPFTPGSTPRGQIE